MQSRIKYVAVFVEDLFFLHSLCISCTLLNQALLFHTFQKCWTLPTVIGNQSGNVIREFLLRVDPNLDLYTYLDTTETLMTLH